MFIPDGHANDVVGYYFFLTAAADRSDCEPDSLFYMAVMSPKKMSGVLWAGLFYLACILPGVPAIPERGQRVLSVHAESLRAGQSHTGVGGTNES